MGYLDMVEKFMDDKDEYAEQLSVMPSIEQLPYMTLDELAHRDIAIQIFSEMLGSEIWLCSNEDMVSQLNRDNPSAITYTVDELIDLIKLQPNADDIIRINHAKKVFANSRIIDSKLKREIT